MGKAPKKAAKKEDLALHDFRKRGGFLGLPRNASEARFVGIAENQPLKKESHALHDFRKKAVDFPLVEMRGIEPLSETAYSKGATSVVNDRDSPAGRFIDKPARSVAS